MFFGADGEFNGRICEWSREFPLCLVLHGESLVENTSGGGLEKRKST